jgi:hypothetical protein
MGPRGVYDIRTRRGRFGPLSAPDQCSGNLDL